MDPTDKNGDYGYVCSTWVTTARVLPQFLFAPRETFDRAWYPRVRATLERSSVVIAADVADEWHILGFAVAEECGGLPEAVGLLLHYVCVVEQWRGRGIGNSLLAALGLAAGPIYSTHYNERAWKERVRYMPSLFRRPKGKHAPAPGLRVSAR